MDGALGLLFLVHFLADLVPFLEARAASRGCVVVIQTTVGALWRVWAFEVVPLRRFERRFVGSVFGFVSWLTAMCAVWSEDALASWMSSLLTE